MRGNDLERFFRIRLFDSVSREDARKLSGAIPVKDFEEGRHVYTPVYGGRILFLLLWGRVRTYRMEGAREITLSLVGDGEMFGEAALTTRRQEGAWAQAMRPSRVGLLSCDVFGRFVQDHPLAGLKAAELLAERLSLCEERLASVALKNVPSRLAGLILELTRTEGVVAREGYSIPTRYSHEQLGAMIGAKRVAVTRALTGLRHSGAVEVHGRRIHVRDMEALRRAATRGDPAR